MSMDVIVIFAMLLLILLIVVLAGWRAAGLKDVVEDEGVYDES